MSQPTLSRRRWRLEPNPILVKEVRSQLRNGRVFVLLTGLLLGLGAAGYGLFLTATRTSNTGQPVFSAQIGQMLFGGLAFALAFGVCLIAPAVTVGAISSERERQTYEMLVATHLSPGRILWGKLIASLSYVALLLLAAIPLGSIVFLFGGLTFKIVLQVLTVIIVTAVTAAMLGLWASSLFGRTGRAAIATYLLLGLIVFGLPFTSYIWSSSKNTPVPQALIAPNPITAVASALTPLGVRSSDAMMAFPAGGGAVFDRAMALDPTMFNQAGVGINSIPGWRFLSLGLYPPADPMNPVQPTPRSIWRTTLVIEIMACLILFWMSLHLVRPKRRWRLGWGDLAMLATTSTVLLGLGFWRGWWLR